jgi:hypothetical protein
LQKLLRGELRMQLLGLAILLIAFLPAAGRAGAVEIPSPPSVKIEVPTWDFPRALQEAWIQFHELELCQSIEAEFAFHHDGIDVLRRADDDVSGQKLERLLNPLRANYQIHLSEAPFPGIGDMPPGAIPEVMPPSLWNNDKLRLYMQNIFAPTSAILAGRGNEPKNSMEVDRLVKQSLALFSRQTLDWGRRMGRYALDLPLLADAAFNANASPELKSRAAEVCIAHVLEIDRLAQKLSDNLDLALPNSGEPFRLPSPSNLAASEKTRPFEEAKQLSAMARNITRRIHGFIYPQTFTVNLSDLKEPRLLEALKDLRLKAMIFLKHMDSAGKT